MNLQDTAQDGQYPSLPLTKSVVDRLGGGETSGKGVNQYRPRAWVKGLPGYFNQETEDPLIRRPENGTVELRGSGETSGEGVIQYRPRAWVKGLLG